MKITFEDRVSKITIENNAEEINDVLDAICVLLRGATFAESTIRSGIIELAEEFKGLEECKDTEEKN